MKSKLILILLLSCFAVCQAEAQKKKNYLLRTVNSEFFVSEEARRIGDQVLLFQRVTGGWPKNIDMTTELTDEEKQAVLADKDRQNDSTTDNGATTMQMNFLARLYNATGDDRYREGFIRGVEYLLSGQYENGGWPQFWPVMRDYQIHITYNDDAMANTMQLLRDIAECKEPYSVALTDENIRTKAMAAFNKGIECILKTQIIRNGEPTVWCQQHDRETFEPAPARAYELPSFCSQESVTLTHLLMSLPNPDNRIKRAVHGAMKWFDQYKITGYRYRHYANGNPSKQTGLEKSDNATPIWARFYDLEYCEPYFCDRDGIMRRDISQIGSERRNGYAWFGDRAIWLYKTYEEWADKYDRDNKLDIRLDSPGGNETGLIQLGRRPVVNPKHFNAVVKPGQSIQKAIDKAVKKRHDPTNLPSGEANKSPLRGDLEGSPYIYIYIKNGVYNEKVILHSPKIVLVGESRDSTILQLAETAETQKVKEYKGQKVGNGVVVLTENADSCVISGLTIYNNYGTTVENTTKHQMAVYGRASHTIITNCNIWADGNDALSLWAPGGNGMYYHADLNLRCRGVDFLCPRGWCYATRCTFYGNGHAMIWHDGRGDQSKRLVITDSQFDATVPTQLGRWHHDSKFFIANCYMSANVMDEDIAYAYKDKVLDPCPWGKRVYYNNCYREGGHSGWLADNLKTSEEKPEYHQLTARWTFNEQWNPEKQIRDLWKWVAY